MSLSPGPLIVASTPGSTTIGPGSSYMQVVKDHLTMIMKIIASIILKDNLNATQNI